MVYNVYMKRFTTTIIGGGAAGLFAAARLSTSQDVLLLERGERLGKKLSATGNGQGNITNLAATETDYFSVCGEDHTAPSAACLPASP